MPKKSRKKKKAKKEEAESALDLEALEVDDGEGDEDLFPSEASDSDEDNAAETKSGRAVRYFDYGPAHFVRCVSQTRSAAAKATAKLATSAKKRKRPSKKNKDAVAVSQEDDEKDEGEEVTCSTVLIPHAMCFVCFWNELQNNAEAPTIAYEPEVLSIIILLD
jgi:hypothetical protein